MSKYDRKLVKKCLNGDRGSQRELYDRLRSKLYSICLRYANDSTEAQDFLQEGFIAIFRDLYQWDSEKGTLNAWCARVMINNCLQWIRRRKVRFTELKYDEEPVTNLDDEMREEMSLEKIYDQIRSLPDGYRVVFNMYVLDGYTHKEIAEYLGISTGTSKSQLAKAKKFLQKKILEDRVAYREIYG